jgi:AraC family transcriptional regulator
MVLKEFPNLSWLKVQAEQSFENPRGWTRNIERAGWPNVFLNVKTRSTVRDNIRGPLSIFSNVTGESRVTVGKTSARVRPGFFFLSNHDQYYTLEVEKHHQAETSNVHLGEYFADQVLEAFAKTPDYLLENDFFPPLSRIEFENKLYVVSDELQIHLDHLRLTEHLSEMEMEEKLVVIVHVLLRERKSLRLQSLSIDIVKNSTREELFRRLNRATDFIYSNLDEPLSLRAVAREAGLSKFHFLRLFTQAFSKTPHQFINDIKITQAKTMLRNKQPVQVIARELGYKEPGTFSRAFRKSVGVYPTQLFR